MQLLGEILVDHVVKVVDNIVIVVDVLPVVVGVLPVIPDRIPLRLVLSPRFLTVQVIYCIIKMKVKCLKLSSISCKESSINR